MVLGRCAATSFFRSTRFFKNKSPRNKNITLPKLYWITGAYTYTVYGRTWDLTQHGSYLREHKGTTHTYNPGELTIQKEVRTRMKNKELVKNLYQWSWRVTWQTSMRILSETDAFLIMHA